MDTTPSQPTGTPTQHQAPTQNQGQIVAHWIIAGILFGFVASFCVVALFAWFGKVVPEPIAHLLDVSFGSIATLLVQTGIGRRAGDTPTAQAIGQAVSDASQVQPLRTDESDGKNS